MTNKISKAKIQLLEKINKTERFILINKIERLIKGKKENTIYQ